MSISKIQHHKTISDFIEPRLNNVKANIRLIDPSLLGEKRYDGDAYCQVTKKIFDLLCFLKWLICYPLVKKWNETRAGLENRLADLEAVKTIIRRIDPQLLGEATSSWRVVRPVLNVFYFMKRQAFRCSLISLGNELEKQLGPIQCVATTYAELPMSNEEKGQVKKLIQMVANDSIPSLIKRLGQLLEAKRKLYGIHPLKSFEFMLNDPEVLKNLKKLSQTPERWDGVPLIAKGFKPQSAEKFRKYHAQGSVLPYLPDFIKSLGLSKSQAKTISALAQAGKWEEMIQALVDNRS